MSQYNVVMQVSLRDPSPQNLARLRSSIQSSLTGVNFNINTSNISRAQRSLRALQRTQDDCVDSANELAEALVLKGRNFFAYALASSAILRVGSALTDSVGEAIKFEKELSTIAQTTNSTLNSVKSFSKELISISKNYGIASVKVAEFTRTFAQAGLSIKDSIKAAELLSKTTLVGTFESTTETMEAMIATMSAFGRKAGDLEKDLASVNAISKQFAVENTDLVEVIKRSGGAFKAAGGSLEELLALFTSVRSYSREAPETIATGLNTVIGRLQRPKTIEYFENLGISLTDVSGNFIGMYQAIERISSSLESIGANPGSIKFAEIVEQLGGLRQQPRVVPLLRNFEEAQKALNVATNNGISLDEDAIKAKETLAFKIQELKRNFDALIVEIADSSSFKIIAESMLKMANAAIELTRAISPLVPLIAGLAGARVGLGVIRTVSSVGGSFRSFIRRADGGPVPGIGDGDTVPALLTPGEFVVKKRAVKKLGLQTLFRLNKFADGGPVGLTESLKSQGSNLAGDMTRATGSVIANLQEMRKVFEETVKHLSSASAEFVSKTQLTGIKDSGTRGYFSPGSTPQINITPKVGTVSTVEHEIGHAVDYGLAGGKGYASQQEGTLQNKLVAQARSKVEAFHKNAGVTGDRLAYLTSDVEIFADLFQKSSPEVRKILSSTTDAAEGMKKLAELIDQENGQHIRLYADLQDYVKEQGKASGVIKQNPRHQIQRINNTVTPIRTVPPPLPPNARRRVGQSPTPLGPPAPQGPIPQGPMNQATPSQMAFIRNISGATNPIHYGPAPYGPNVPTTDPQWIANFLKQQNRSNPLSPDPANGIIGAAPTSAIAFGMSQAAGLSKAQQTFLNSTSSVNAITPTGKAAINGPKYGPYEPSLELPKFTAMLGLATAGLATLAQGFVDTNTEFGRVASSLLTVVQTAGLLQTSLREVADIGIGDVLKFATNKGSGAVDSIRGVGRGLSRLPGGKAVGGLLASEGASKALASLASKAVAAAAGMAAIYGLGTVIDSIVGAEEKKKKAIEEGNVIAAGENAAKAQSASDLNKLNIAIVGVASIFGPLGTAIGLAVSATLKLVATFTPFGKIMESVTGYMRDFLASFGLADTSDVTKKKAEAEAAGVKFTKDLGQAFKDLEKDVNKGTEKSRARVFNNDQFKKVAESLADDQKRARATGDNTAIKAASERSVEAFDRFKPVFEGAMKDFVNKNIREGKGDKAGSFEEFFRSLDKNSQIILQSSGKIKELTQDQSDLADIAKTEQANKERLNALYQAEQAVYSKKIAIESTLNNSLLSLSKAAYESSQSLSAIQAAANPEALQSITSDFAGQLGDISNVFDSERFTKSVSIGASTLGTNAGVSEILKGADFAKQISNPNGLVKKALELGGTPFADIQNQLEAAKESPQSQEDILSKATSGLLLSIGSADDEVRAKISNGFKDLIKNAEGRIDPKAVQDLLTETLVTPAQELANKQKEAIEKQIAILNNYSASLRAINETDQKILESKLASLKGQQEFSNSLNEIRSDKPTSPFKMQFDSVMRQSQILSGEGDSSKLIGNADALSDAIKQTENRIYRLNERFQAGEALDKASVEQQEANKARLQKLNEALDEQINTYGEMKSALLDVAKAERDKAKQVKAELLAKVTKPIEERIKGAQANVAANQLIRGQLNPNLISTQYASMFRGSQQTLVQEQQSRIIEALQRKADGEGPEAERAKTLLNQISSNSAALDTNLENQFGGTIPPAVLKRIKRKNPELAAIIEAQNAAGQNTQDLIIKGTTKKGLAAEAKAEEINKREAAAIKEREDVLKNRKEIQRGELAKTQQAPAQPQGLQEKDIAIMQQFAKSMQPIAESMKKFVEMPKEFTHKFDAGAMTVNIPAAAILQKLPDALKLVILDEINNEIGNIAKKVKEQLQAGG